MPIAIACDDQSAEAECSATLDDLGASIDLHDGGFNATLVNITTITLLTATTLRLMRLTLALGLLRLGRGGLGLLGRGGCLLRLFLLWDLILLFGHSELAVSSVRRMGTL